MPAFMTRVVLHNGDRDDYEELHQYMSDEGFVKTITDENATWELPDAMYDYRTNDEKVTTLSVREKAKGAANKTKKGNTVFTVKYTAWSSMGLTKASP